MTVTLTPEMEQIVTQEVNTGRFASPEEVIAECLRLFKQYFDVERNDLESLRSEIDKGYERARQHGMVAFDPDALLARIDSHLADEQSAAHAA